MSRYWKIGLMLLLAVLTLTGCSLRTVDALYCLPKRSEAYNNLQSVIDKAMADLEYAAPTYGDNRQVVQLADLDGDGVDEYLLFAKDNSEKPLKILIFCQLASGYVLMDTIEGYGFAFDFVDYAQVDDRPGVEIIVGRQLSDQVMRAVSVYRFTSGFSRQLLSTGYTRLSVCDLNADGRSELFLLNHGVSQDSNGIATLYHYDSGEMHRSAELSISAPAASFKRITAGLLQGGKPAVYVTCAADEKTLVTDIFTDESGQFTAVVKGITTQTLHNYYVYAEDVDSDGVPEMPQPIPLLPGPGSSRQQYLLRWYAVDSSGMDTTKRYTYHNYTDGWYLLLDHQWINKLSVVHTEDACTFYILSDGKFEKILTITALTDADRQDQAQQKGRIVLYSSDSVIYVADLEAAAAANGITEENLPARFRPIRMDLNTEED